MHIYALYIFLSCVLFCTDSGNTHKNTVCGKLFAIRIPVEKYGVQTAGILTSLATGLGAAAGQQHTNAGYNGYISKCKTLGEMHIKKKNIFICI